MITATYTEGKCFTYKIEEEPIAENILATHPTARARNAYMNNETQLPT